MDRYDKLSKNDIKELTKDIRPYVYIGDRFYKEKFKQVYHMKQGDKRKDGIYLPYLISSFGRVFSIKSDYILYERKVPTDKHGYKLVVMNHHKKVFGVRVHRLVANAFIKKKSKKQIEVNHIDGIKTHNYVWNLEWATSSENKQHAIKHNLSNFARGEKSGRNIYKEYQIEEVCRLLEEGDLTNREISDRTCVNVHIVNDVYKRRIWLHVSRKYDFAKRINKDIEYRNKINLICRLLESNISYKRIENIAHVNFKTISAILNKKLYRSISDNYDFSNYNYGK